MEILYAFWAVGLLLGLVLWLARRSGQQEEKRVALEYSLRIKEAQLKRAAEPQPSGADLLDSMRKGDF